MKKDVPKYALAHPILRLTMPTLKMDILKVKEDNNFIWKSGEGLALAFLRKGILKILSVFSLTINKLHFVYYTSCCLKYLCTVNKTTHEANILVIALFLYVC
jgi:hypothetical protein